MITVKISKDDLVEMLCNRVEYLTNDAAVVRLFRDYYYENAELMDGMELDINKIVDNDYYNNFNIYESIEEIMQDFRENEDEIKDRIVMHNGDLYLVRAD